MKKAVVAASIVILGAGSWATASWYTGKQLEIKIPEQLAKYNEYLAKLIPDAPLKLTQLSYERGFFSTTAHFVLSPAEDNTEDKLDFDVKIDHGPFPAGALAQGHFLPKMGFFNAALAKTDITAPAFALTKDKTPIQTDGTVTYSGNVSSVSTIAPIDYQNETITVNFGGAIVKNQFVRKTREVGTVLQIDTLSVVSKETEEPTVAKLDGMTLDVTYRPAKVDPAADPALRNDLNIHDVRSKFTLKSLSLKNSSDFEPFTLVAQDMNLVGSYQPGSFGIPLIDSSFSIKRTEANYPKKDIVITIDNFGYALNLTEDKKSLSHGLSYTADGLTINKLVLGKAALGVKLNNLDGAVMRDLMGLYQQTKAALTDEDANPMNKFALIGTASQLGMRLLEANPELRIEPLSLRTDKGESSFNAAITFTKPSNIFGASTQEIALQVIKRIDAKAVVSKPMLAALATEVMQQNGMSEADAKAEVAQALQGLAMIEAMGIAKQDGDNLVSTFHYADGVAKLNDQEFSQDQIKEMLQEVGLGDRHPLDEDDDNDESDESDDSGNTNISLSPKQIARILESHGYTSELETSSEGNPLLVLEPGETHANKLDIEFRDCIQGTYCDDILIRAEFKTPKPIPLKVINRMNRQERWVRIHLGEKNEVVVEMDVSAVNGLKAATLDHMLNTFFSSTHSIAHDVMGSSLQR